MTSPDAKGWRFHDAADDPLEPVASQRAADEPRVEVYPVDEDGDVEIVHWEGGGGQERVAYVDHRVLAEVLRRAGWTVTSPGGES